MFSKKPEMMGRKTEDLAQLKIIIRRICSFSFVGLVLLVVANGFFEATFSSQTNYRFLQYRELVDHEAKANIVIMGSSRSLNGINPRYLDDDCKTFYNFSTGGANKRFFNQWYKTILKKYYPKPDVIILEASNFIFESLLSSIKGDIAYFPAGMFFDSLIRPDFPVDFQTIFKEKNKTRFLSDHILFTEKTDKIGGFFKGYVPSGYRHIVPDTQFVYEVNKKDSFTPSPADVQSFIELLETLHRDEIKVILVDPPVQALEWISVPKKNPWVTKIAKAKNIAFIDYNSGDKATSFNYNTYNFNDDLHMNNRGSSIFSKKLRKDIEPLLPEKKSGC